MKKRITIEVDAPIHKKVKSAATNKGQTIKEWLMNLIRKKINK